MSCLVSPSSVRVITRIRLRDQRDVIHTYVIKSSRSDTCDFRFFFFFFVFSDNVSFDSSSRRDASVALAIYTSHRIWFTASATTRLEVSKTRDVKSVVVGRSVNILYSIVVVVARPGGPYRAGPDFLPPVTSARAGSIN